MYEFEYHRPASIDEAKKILGGNDGVPVCKGPGQAAQPGQQGTKPTDHRRGVPGLAAVQAMTFLGGNDGQALR